MPEPIHITTAIAYCNAAPHVGTAYEALATDTFARYQRRKRGAANTSFVTGTDEHGDKLRRAAADHQLAPQPFADKMSAIFRRTWEGLGVSFDYFVRTTDPSHEQFVRQMLTRTHERGHIYFKDYEGLYCVPCERFYSERELVDATICPTHNRPAEQISEGNYFLRLEQYRSPIIERIQRDPAFIRPERYRSEALNMLAEPLADLCISRPKSRLDWGVELPFDANYVTYVWYDAFWAYASAPAAARPDFMTAVWPNTWHFIGKDILKTHIVYWPAILMAAGEPLFRCLNVHGWVNFGGQRMSKSSGNVADPLSYERAFGADVLRYFLLREVVYGLDGDFSEERLTERYNADLANDLGNLTSRVLAMAERYFAGEIKAPVSAAAEAVDRDLIEIFSTLAARAGEQVEALAFNRALEAIWQALDAANKYITQTSPFTLARDAAKLERVAQILAVLLEGLRVVADTLEPFMPVTARKLLAMLAAPRPIAGAPFGQGLRPGHVVKPPAALFPRIDKPKAG